ncbi:MAG: YbbR-like domain-containing protein [Oscillospiraceae bacterium]
MKNILNIVRDFFRRIMEKDFSIKIISLISAVVIWFVISINVYPTIKVPIYNVPVIINTAGTYAEAHNFRVTLVDSPEATVHIEGDRGEVGALTNKELTVVASAENVLSAGEYRLPLEVKCSSGKQFTVDNISDSEGNKIEYVTARFEEIITKTIEVKPRLEDIHIASGYICDEDDVVIVPDTIEITGPKDKVNSIDAAYVNVSSAQELSASYEFSSGTAVLYSGSSPVELGEDIELNRSDFSVHVPVLMRQTLPLEVNIINAPESFDTNAFLSKLELSVDSLEVAVLSENAKNIASLNIGSIDMRSVDIGSVFTFNTKDFLPEGYQDLSGVNNVTVKCPEEGLIRMLMVVNKNSVQFINAPAQFEYKIITSGFSMYFIGSAESMKQISPIDVIARIDLINYDLEARDYKFPVTFSTPAYNDVWCIGSDGELSPKATVTVTLKEPERS